VVRRRRSRRNTGNPSVDLTADQTAHAEEPPRKFHDAGRGNSPSRNVIRWLQGTSRWVAPWVEDIIPALRFHRRALPLSAVNRVLVDAGPDHYARLEAAKLFLRLLSPRRKRLTLGCQRAAARERGVRFSRGEDGWHRLRRPVVYRTELRVMPRIFFLVADDLGMASGTTHARWDGLVQVSASESDPT